MDPTQQPPQTDPAPQEQHQPAPLVWVGNGWGPKPADPTDPTGQNDDEGSNQTPPNHG